MQRIDLLIRIMCNVIPDVHDKAAVAYWYVRLMRQRVQFAKHERFVEA